VGATPPNDLYGAAGGQYARHATSGHERLNGWAPQTNACNADLIASWGPFARRTEQLRALRTQLLMRWSHLGAARRALAIVSPNSGEGRSYVAANLAVLFAQLGQRTLLIDADLRAPRQSELFNVQNRMGLAAVLAGRLGREAAVALPAFGPLFLVPAGAVPPNLQELLLRPTLSAFLGFMEGLYDVVLLDTPPAGANPDAQGVAFSAGNALLLAHAGHTRVDETAALASDLDVAGVRVLGTVLNVF